MVAVERKLPVAIALLALAVLAGPASIGRDDLIYEFLASPICLENTDIVPTNIPALPGSR